MIQVSASLQEQLDNQRKRVDVDHFDITVRELERMTLSGEIVRSPEYQRKFRWNAADESKLIESIFLGFPVPSIFVATNTDGTWELVDGLQRLSTILHFLTESKVVLSELDKQECLRLEGLEKLSRFNGFTFEQLSTPIRLHFQKRSLRVTALSDKSDPEVRFDTFERLNNGGITLTAQEVRACIFRGEFTEYVRDMGEQRKFTRLLKLQKRRKNDGTPEEEVLKFHAYLNDRENFKGKLKNFLNDYAKKANQAFDKAAAEAEFMAAIDVMSEVLNGQPFLRKGYPVTPLTQFEAAMIAVAEILKEGGKVDKPSAGWIEDREFIEASASGSNSKQMLERRINRARYLLSSSHGTPHSNGRSASDVSGDQ